MDKTKQDSSMAAYKRHNIRIDTILKWRDEKCLVNRNKKKAEVALLTSDKIYFKIKIVIKDKVGITYW